MPYQRDAGMSETEARDLAIVITDVAAVVTSVEREGRFFVVTVNAAGGTFIVRDERDWRWLAPKLSAT